MLAEKNNAFSETAQTLYELNSDEITEMKCRARRDYYKQKNTTEKILNELEAQKKKLTSENEALSSENEALSSENEALKARIAELEAQQNK